MDSERRKQVGDLLQSVLECPPDQRDAFLRQSCAGDQALEREVRSRLTTQQEAAGFLDRPAIEVAARALSCNENQVADKEFPLLHRPESLALPGNRKAGWRRNGSGVQGGGHRPWPLRRPEISSRRLSPRSAITGAFPPGGASIGA